MADAPRKVVALIDSVRWTDADGTICEFEGKGQTFDLPASELDRLVGCGAVEAAAQKKPAKPSGADGETADGG